MMLHVLLNIIQARACIVRENAADEHEFVVNAPKTQVNVLEVLARVVGSESNPWDGRQSRGSSQVWDSGPGFD
jgi:hypothetical protein